MATSAAKRRVTRETVTEIEADEPEELEPEAAGADELHLEAPLFSPLLRRAKRIESVGVRRTDPDSGYLGAMPPDVTEATLKARWGGGTYKLEGRNAAGQMVADGVRMCKLAGDPIFASELEEKQWRKSNGLPDKAAAPAAGVMSMKDLLLLINEKDEARRIEQLEREERMRKDNEEREARERATREEREAKDRAAREELEARRQKDADEREERRRAAAREDDERRARTHREDMERMAAQNASALQQTQQFFNQLATTMKSEAAAPAADPIKTLLAGVQLAQAMGGGGGGDEGPLTALVKRLPETLAEARKTGAAAIAEMKGAAGRGGGRKGDELTITGALASKAKTVIKKLQASGKDPLKEIDQLLTFAAASIPDPEPKASASGAPRRTATTRRRPTLVKGSRR